MADIIPFPKKERKQQKAVKAGKGNTLCKSGFHKWKTDNATDFSVKQGKLQTLYCCERCGKTRTEFT